MASSIASPTDGWLASARGVWPRARRPLAIAAGALLLATAAVVTTRTDVFRVRGIDVDGWGHRSRAEIVRLSGITLSDNAVWLDESSAESRLLRDPWIARADVQIDLPWRVTISVTQRSPIASTRREGERVLVAGDGTILGPGPAAGITTIVAPPAWVDPGGGVRIAQAARALSALDGDLRSRVRHVVVGGPDGLELMLTDGLRVRLGSPDHYEAKTRVLREVLAWIDEADTEFRAIDVSAPSAPTVTAGA